MKPRCRDCKFWKLRGEGKSYRKLAGCINPTICEKREETTWRPGDYEIYHRTHCSYFMTPEGRIE